MILPVDMANKKRDEAVERADEVRMAIVVKLLELMLKLLGKIDAEIDAAEHIGTGHLTEYVATYESLCRAEQARLGR